MKRKIKLGIIGTGLAAKNLHLPAIKKLRDKFEITAVCNHTLKKAEDFAKLAGDVPIYRDYRDLLKDINVEAVDITLPIHLNYKVAADSLLNKKHVFLEKPLTSTVREAKKLIAMKEKHKDCTVLLAENFRYRKVYQTVLKLLNKKAISEVYAAQWNVFYNVSSEKDYGATKWRQQHKYPGGFMLDAGVHNVAALRMLFGEVKSVSAFSANINPKIGKPDTMSAQLKFNSGVKVIYNIFFTVKYHWENKLLIFGKNGTIEVNDDHISVKRGDKTIKLIDASDDGGYIEEFLNFYDAVVSGNKIISTFEEGLSDMKVIIAALKSASIEKTIRLK